MEDRFQLFELQFESWEKPQRNPGARLRLTILSANGMMTTIAGIAGSLPLALGTGNGAELRQPLGDAIIGGLVVSQALTLYTTPAVYLLIDSWRERRRRKDTFTGSVASEPTI